MNLLDLSQEERVNFILRTNSPELIYDLLAKHLQKSKSDIISDYKVELDLIRRRVNISANPDKLYELFTHLENFLVKFESITTNLLRIDLYEFLTRIK